MSFQKGDRVKAIDDVLEGTITQIIGGGLIKVDCAGFEYTFMSHEVVKVLEEDEIEIQDQLSRMKLKAKDLTFKSPEKKKSKVQRNERGVMEVDLHLHEILEDESGIHHGEKLRIQLDHCRKAIDKARRNNEKRLVIIHGVGEGKLRAEVRELLDHLPGVQYHDASYKLYGYGATEVEL